jgi:AcrR family transcriptional regulator
VSTRAGVSESTFRDIFPTVEECHRAAFEQGLDRLSQVVDQAARREVSWLDRLRTGLVAFLGFFDDEPAWGRLLLLETPFTDPTAESGRQIRVLGVLTSLLDSDAPLAAGERVLEPSLTSEFVVGGAAAVIRAQMSKRDGTVLVGLAPSLMSFMVRPYLGQLAANTELEGRPSTNGEASGVGPALTREAELARAGSLPIRVTHRTTMVLRAIAKAPYSNNRKVADAAGLSDEGQASKLLTRLERRGVIENVGVGASRGEPNAWLLTASGRRMIRLIEENPRLGGPRPGGARMRGAA